MRVPVKIGLSPLPRIFVTSDDEALACEFADFLATDPSLVAIADWLFDRGLDVGVSAAPHTQE